LETITITDRVPDRYDDHGVTDHGIQRIISGVLANLLGSIIMSQAGAGQVCEAIREAGYVIVPRAPTKEMMEAAWADALSEDAAAVWSSMIESAESTRKSA
jgi:hypothetical protein